MGRGEPLLNVFRDFHPGQRARAVCSWYPNILQLRILDLRKALLGALQLRRCRII